MSKKQDMNSSEVHIPKFPPVKLNGITAIEKSPLDEGLIFLSSEFNWRLVNDNFAGVLLIPSIKTNKL